MADLLRVFTTGHMKDATITAITSEATGFPKANMLNQNLDDFWKPTGTGDQTITIDFGSAKAVLGLFIWFRNISALNGMALQPQSSANGSTWANVGGGILGVTTRQAHLDEAVNDTKRYWRLNLTSIPAVPEIAMIAFCSRAYIDQANNVPQLDVERFHNLVTPLDGGRMLVHPLNSRVRRSFSRQWTFISASLMTEFQDAFRDSYGDSRPCIFVEGSYASNPEPVVCRMTAEWQRSQPAYDMYDVGITFDELPSIPEGQLY